MVVRPYLFLFFEMESPRYSENIFMHLHPLGPNGDVSQTKMDPIAYIFD